MSIVQIFAIFFAVNLFTIGGGYVMLPVLHDIFVYRYQLLTQREFLDAVALGQLSPGPLTIMNAFIGYKLMGFLGAAAATVGTYLPSLTVVTLVVKYYVRFRESKWLDAAVKGIKPAVVGLLLATAIMLGKSSLVDPGTMIICAASFFLIAFTRLDPTIVVILSGVAGFAFL
jgi:chromate transporter